VEPAVAATTQENKTWRKTTAKIKIESVPIEELNVQKSLISFFIKSIGKQPKDFLESDQKNLLFFSMKYDASVKMKKKEPAIKKRITQYGLYRTLHPKLQQAFINNTSPTSIRIRYELKHPIAIQFIMNQEVIESPTLMTDTIDCYWESTGEPVLLPDDVSD
jgi:hypothetical protein